MADRKISELDEKTGALADADQVEILDSVSNDNRRSAVAGIRAGLVTRAEFNALVARVAALEGMQPTAVDHYYFGWSTSGVVTAADFAAATDDDDGVGTLPAQTTDAHIWFAVPSGIAVTAIFIAGGTRNQYSHYIRQSTTVDDPNGAPHDVYVTDDVQVALLFSGAAFEIQHN